MIWRQFVVDIWNNTLTHYNTPTLTQKHLPFSQIFAPHFDAFVHSLSVPFMSHLSKKKFINKRTQYESWYPAACHWLLLMLRMFLVAILIFICLSLCIMPGLTLACLWYVILRGIFKVKIASYQFWWFRDGPRRFCGGGGGTGVGGPCCVWLMRARIRLIALWKSTQNSLLQTLKWKTATVNY